MLASLKDQMVSKLVFLNILQLFLKSLLVSNSKITSTATDIIAAIANNIRILRRVADPVQRLAKVFDAGVVLLHWRLAVWSCHPVFSLWLVLETCHGNTPTKNCKGAREHFRLY